VYMQDTVETSSHDGLQVKKHDLRFKLRHAMDWSFRRAENVTGEDILFFHTSEANAYLITTCRCRNLVFLLSIEGRN
jgi:hypothetical protein